jgi:dTMP kinase
MFFSFDGVDGAGKSTQVDLFCRWLAEQGLPVVSCRDPGSTPLGERIRDLLLTANADWQIHRRAEMLLYMAARSQLVEEVIRPALSTGKVVVADRFLLANLVYQGHAGGLPIEDVRIVGRVCTAGVLPDCVFVLDISPDEAQRRFVRELDRMEKQGPEFERRIRDGFLREAARDPDRTHVINAARSVEVIHQEIQAIARKYLTSGPSRD